MDVTDRYVELLANEGYRPKVDEDDETEILFKAERLRFRMSLDSSDPAFVAITLSFSVEEGHALEKLLAVANEQNQRAKVVKVLVHPGGKSVRFSFEALCAGTLPLDLLERAIAYLRGVSDDYFEEIRKADPEAKA
jgi:hypothetical protein